MAVIQQTRTPDFLDYSVNFFKKGPDKTKDALDACDHLAQWTTQLCGGQIGKAASEISEELGPVKSFFAIPSFFIFGNQCRRNFQKWNSGDEKPGLGSKVVTSAALTVFAGSETVICLGSLKPLKEFFKNAVKIASVTLWGALFIVDGKNFLHHLNKIDSLKKSLLESSSAEEKGFLQKKINLNYLKVVKDLSTVALAVISLLGMAFAVSATSVFAFVFSPALFLTIGTVNIALSIGNSFYGMRIKTEEESLKNSLSVLAKV